MQGSWNCLAKLQTVGWVMLMIVAVVVIQGIVSIVRMRLKHDERMAMIEKGMDPDAAKKTKKEGED